MLVVCGACVPLWPFRARVPSLFGAGDLPVVVFVPEQASDEPWIKHWDGPLKETILALHGAEKALKAIIQGGSAHASTTTKGGGE
eukprot:9158485-Pyramimonas_sp.AAC.1